jgi:hypothetical protein
MTTTQTITSTPGEQLKDKLESDKRTFKYIISCEKNSTQTMVSLRIKEKVIT